MKNFGTSEMIPLTKRSPRLRISIRNLYNLKHDGNHCVRVGYKGKYSESAFREGSGRHKPIHYTTDITLSDVEALDDGTWDWGSINVQVIHERLFGSDKMVGECFIPLSRVRSGRVSDLLPLLYKGHERGSIELSVEVDDLPVKPASVTVPLDPGYRERVLRIRESSSRSISPKSPKSHRHDKNLHLPSVSDGWP